MEEPAIAEYRNGRMVSREICIDNEDGLITCVIDVSKEAVEPDEYVQQLGIALASLLCKPLSVMVVETTCYEFDPT